MFQNLKKADFSVCDFGCCSLRETYRGLHGSDNRALCAAVQEMTIMMPALPPALRSALLACLFYGSLATAQSPDPITIPFVNNASIGPDGMEVP